MLTQERLKELVHYDPATGLVTRLERVCGAAVGDVMGSTAKTNRHMRMRLEGKRYAISSIACMYMTGSWPKVLMDHKDHNPINNKWENLREATFATNAQNMSKRSHGASSTGIVGVYKTKFNTYRASIKANGIVYRLGSHKNIESAISARKAAEIEHGFHENHGK